jgi:TonB-linked SusC/RagA family outer membrane protein
MRTDLLIGDFFALLYKRFLITAFSLLLLVSSYRSRAQNPPPVTQHVTIKVNDASLDEVLLILRRQVKLQFIIDAGASGKANNIRLDMKDTPLTEVLNKALAGTGLEYVINKNVVIIRVTNEPKLQDTLARVQFIPVSISIKSEDGMALGGASVTDATDNTKTGMADNKGQLLLNLQPNARLRISFIGFETQVLYVGNRKQITVMLKTTQKAEDEVVITGYQKLRAWESVGSTVKVKGEDMRIAGIPRVDLALQGQIPGVNITIPNGTVGSNPKIRVRGTSTLLGNREPVWVVDGIIREDPFPFKDQNIDNIVNAADKTSMLAGLSIMSNGIAGLNPDDIEDITFLKDASATALYGVRAANGVIVITTKRGKAGRTNINFRSDVSVTEKPNYNRQNLMNSSQRVALSKELIERGVNYSTPGQQGSNLLTKDGPQNVGYEGLYYLYISKQISQAEFNEGVTRLETTNTDWFNELFRNAINKNNTLSISGGSDKSTFYGSMGYSTTANSAIGNDQKRMNALINMEYRLNNSMRWHIGLQANATKVNGFYGNVNPEQYALYTNRELAANQIYSTVKGYTYITLANGASSSMMSNLKYNFRNELAHTGNTTDTRGIMFNTDLQITLTKNLSFQTMFSQNLDRSSQERWADENSYFVAQIRGANLGELPKGSAYEQASVLARGGVLEREDMNRDGYLFRNSLNYNKTLGGHQQHSISAMGGFEMRSNTYKGAATKNYGYFPDRGDVIDYDYSIAHPGQLVSDAFADKYYNKRTNTLTNFVSYYTSLTWSFKRKYTMNLNGRSDASNRFGQYTNAAFNPVWAIGARWDVLAEKWFENRLHWINAFTIRSSFGFQGNIVDNIGPNLIAQYSSPVYNPLNGESYLNIKTMPYPDLRKEKTRTWNAGIDLSFLDNRVAVTFDYYYKYSKDLISQRTVPVEYGTTQMYVNGSDMTNSGYDLSLRVIPVKTRDWMWSIQFNTSVNKNSVVDPRYTPTIKTLTNGTALVNGYPVDAFWSFPYAGLNHNTGRPMFKYLDVDTNSAILKSPDATNYLVYSGNSNPRISGGINTSLRYRNILLAATFNVQLNYHLRLNPIMLAGSYGQYQAPAPDKNASSFLVNRWQKPGDEQYTDIPAIYASDEFVNGTLFNDKSISVLAGTWYRYSMYNYSDLRVVNGSHLRCNNIALSYMFKKQQLGRLKVFNQLSLSANVTNPFVIASKTLHGQDPEVLSSDASSTTPTMSRMRTVSFSLNAGF